MNNQLELWETPRPKLPNQRLFLALFPDDPSARLIQGLASEMRRRHNLTGTPRPLDHLHMTLRWINDYVEIPQSTVEDVRRACEAATAQMAPFEIKLDRVGSWGNGIGRHPLVLTGHGNNNDALLEFQHALWKELIKCGHPGKGGRDFNPHVTLLYDQRSIPEEPVPPVTWMASGIVLVHSEVGKTQYHYPGRWKLRG
jgi:2'-5' RNA ligase